MSTATPARMCLMSACCQHHPFLASAGEPADMLGSSTSAPPQYVRGLMQHHAMRLEHLDNGVLLVADCKSTGLTFHGVKVRHWRSAWVDLHL